MTMLELWNTPMTMHPDGVGGTVKSPSEKDLRRSFLASVHAKGYRLDKQSYIDILNEFPELYNIFPDDIKCQELELASKL